MRPFALPSDRQTSSVCLARQSSCSDVVWPVSARMPLHRPAPPTFSIMMGCPPDRNNLQNARLRGGAGRTRTNHQSVMEHGWCPTNSPGRTPIQIAGRFPVLLGFPGFLILDQPPECYGTWFESDQLPSSDTLEPPPKCYGIGARPTSPPRRTPVLALKAR